VTRIKATFLKDGFQLS